MTDLDDYTINKRLAEIAGYEVRPAHDTKGPLWLFAPGDPTGVMAFRLWKPLADWAQLMPIVRGEQIDFRWLPESGDLQALAGNGIGERNSDPFRAIALAIIAKFDELEAPPLPDGESE